MSEGPDLSNYRGRRRPPVEDERDPIDPPTAPAARSGRRAEVGAKQLNTRMSQEHRRRLDHIVAEHPRARATIRDVLEELIDERYERVMGGKPPQSP